MLGTRGVQRYLKRPRYSARFAVGSACAVLLCIISACVPHSALTDDRRRAILTVLGIAFVICWCGIAVNYLLAVTFRCPACKKLFNISWYGNWPGNACKHCKLSLV